MSDIKQLVDEYAKWDKLAAEAKSEIEKIRASIQKIAVAEMENSKNKTIKFFGTNNNIAIISTSETVKMVAYTYLKLILGGVIEDFVKEEKSYKMTDAFKKIVAPLCLGNFIEQTLDDVIAQMNVDSNAAKVLKKKLRGDVQKDSKVLASIGMAQQDIDYWIYFINEAVAYERIVRLLEVSGHIKGSPEYNTALSGIKQALIVEEGLKIGIEYEES